MSQNSSPSAQHASRSPEQRVFSTTKLLEMILLNVQDMRTIFLSQRTNKSFYTVIRKSTPLQKLLWFLPKDPENVEPVVIPPFTRHEGNTGLNPLLLEATTQKKHPVITRLLLRPTIDGSRYPTGNAIPEICMEFRRYPLNKGGSWRNMIVFQPHDGLVRWDVGTARPNGFLRPNNQRFLFSEAPTAGKLLNEALAKLGG